jgi:hypothetical protein
MAEALRVFAENVDKLRSVLFGLIGAIPATRGCACGDALLGTPARP